MINNVESLKSHIENKYLETKTSKQIILQNYMFERLLERLSKSNYKNNFILKGGLLLSSIFGIDTRTTMDMDTLIKGINMTKENIEKILTEILNIDVNDNVKFIIIGFTDIKKEDLYGGYKFKLKALYGNLKVDLHIDIATGDIITPKEIEYKYKLMFENKSIELMVYNNETSFAEKFQTIILRNIGSSRMKDFYDVYKFWNEKEELLDIIKLRKAIINTFNYRGTVEMLQDLKLIIDKISKSVFLKNMWTRYQIENEYALNIEFQDICKVLLNIVEVLKLK